MAWTCNRQDGEKIKVFQCEEVEEKEEEEEEEEEEKEEEENKTHS